MFDATVPENVEEAMKAVAQKYAFIHREPMTEAIFLVDRTHRQEHGEALTGATYRKVLSAIDERESVYSDEVAEGYQDFLADGSYEQRSRVERATGITLAKRRSAPVLTAPPDDVPEDEYVDSFVAEVLQDIWDKDETLQNRLYQQKDFVNTVLTKPIEP